MLPIIKERIEIQRTVKRHSEGQETFVKVISLIKERYEITQQVESLLYIKILKIKKY